MKAQTPLDTASRLLGDANNARWDRSSLYAYLTAGLGELGAVRPEAFATLHTFQLADGCVQDMPTGVMLWMGAVRNMGIDGLTPGAVIRNPDSNALDQFDPAWMANDTGSVIDECYYSEDTPEQFLVSPGVEVGADVYIQARVAMEPVDVVDDETEIGIKNTYHMALVHWVLAMAYAENSDRGDKQLALQHEQKFYELLGFHKQAEREAPPAAKKDMT